MKNGITNNNRYDAHIIGHQEYVTQREYDNLKQIVAICYNLVHGTLVMLDGNILCGSKI
jgi:hypothetical protein